MSVDPKKPRPNYETSDAQAWIVAIAGGVLVLMLALVALSSHVTLRLFSRRSMTRANDVSNWVPLPPEPRLQVHPVQDLENMRHEEDLALNQYGWVDADKGIIHIPIDRAITLIAQRHLASRGHEREER